MREFLSNSDDFRSRTLRRVILELAFLVVLVIFCLSALSDLFPVSLKVAAVALTSTYIAYGVFFYPKAKRLASEFRIQVHEKSLAFPDQGKMKHIPFSQLQIDRVIRDNDDVAEIKLITSFGQRIGLRGLEDMQGLYTALEEKVSTS